MSAGLLVLDGMQLRAVDLSLPESDVCITGGQILDVADSRVCSSLFGVSLPETLKTSALKRISTADVDTFRCTEFGRGKAVVMLRDYVAAVAGELKDDPLVVTSLNGSTLRLYLEDEDDFAVLAENLFTDLDFEDKGKISKSKISNALIQMGVEMGVPPFSEFPQLNDILRKYGAEGEEELGQAQFAQLLQTVLQELADALSQKHVIIIQNIKIINGSKLRQLLTNEKELNNIMETVLLEKQQAKDGLGIVEIVRIFLQRNAKELGLPLAEADEAVHFYDDVFGAVVKEEYAMDLEKDKLVKLIKDVLRKFSELLESNPVYQYFDC